MDKIPDYADWMLQTEPDPDDEIPEFEPRQGAPRRSLWDLPIFGRFWAADGADLGR